MASPPPILLASRSPRRASLLSSAGIPFVQWAPEYRETLPPQGTPEERIAALARDKLRQALRADPPTPGEWVLTADTAVVVDERILGKPRNEAEARAMLTLLSGRSHTILTALSLHRRGGPTLTRTALTTVWWAPLTEEEIDLYLASREWQDAAGAYRIQERGGLFITRIEGSYSNVVGLPIHLLYGMLKESGYPYPHIFRP